MKTVTQKLMARAMKAFDELDDNTLPQSVGTQEWEETVVTILYKAVRGAYISGHTMGQKQPPHSKTKRKKSCKIKKTISSVDARILKMDRQLKARQKKIDSGKLRPKEGNSHW